MFLGLANFLSKYFKYCKKIVKSHTKTIFRLSAAFYDPFLRLDHRQYYINVAK